MLSNKDYCDYETCVALKELGYDGCCAAYYHLYDDEYDARNSFEYACGFDFQNSNNIYRVGAPLLYQAQKWLREEKKLFVEITIFEYTYGYRILDSQNVYYDNEHVVRREGHLVGSHEEALSEGIKEAVEILKDGNGI